VSTLSDLKRRLFPKGIRRAGENWRRRLLERATPAALERLFAQLRIEPGSVVCVHSQLSALGYLTGGPRSVIQALQRVVPDVTVMVPTFPFTGTAQEYVTGDPLYDPENTPSKSGFFTETVRTMPGAVRSLHPTHPCAALGPAAPELIEGSEAAETPFGESSTYGRYSRMENAVLLLIHTNGTSMVHRFQEVVDMPNLFLPGLFAVRGLDRRGEEVTYRVRIHTPHLPLYVALPGEGGGRPDYVWLPDFSLLFPEERKARILARLQNPENRRLLLERQRALEATGVVRIARRKGSEVAAIRVGPWQKRVCDELSGNLRHRGEHYAVEDLRAARESGALY
jgi:aminoglycoside N3'-acetyltransferase